MTTSALAMLRAAVDAAHGSDRKAEELARVGVCLAQLGRIDEARDIVLRLRRDYSKGEFPRVSIRLMILEGIVSYYDRIINSSDRVRRAHTLARVAGITDLQAESAVWLAHLAFNFEDYQTLESALGDALSGFTTIDDSHRARVCLLIADAVQYLAERSEANDWYTLARVLSRRSHDHGLMAAIEYNRLGIGLSRIRVERALGRVSSTSQYRDWLVELGSVERLHSGFDARALSELLDLCSAYTYEIRGDFERAHTLLTHLAQTGSVERCGVSGKLLALEIEWCRMKGAKSPCQKNPTPIDRTEIEALSLNERLMALALLNEMTDLRKNELDEDWYIEMMADATEHVEDTLIQMSSAIAAARGAYSKIRSVVMPDGGERVSRLT